MATISAHVGRHEDLIELDFDPSRPESTVFYRYPAVSAEWHSCPYQSADLRHLDDDEACAKVDTWVG